MVVLKVIKLVTEQPVSGVAFGICRMREPNACALYRSQHLLRELHIKLARGHKDLLLQPGYETLNLPTDILHNLKSVGASGYRTVFHVPEIAYNPLFFEGRCRER